VPSIPITRQPGKGSTRSSIIAAFAAYGMLWTSAEPVKVIIRLITATVTLEDD